MIIRNPQYPILITKAPTLPYMIVSSELVAQKNELGVRCPVQVRAHLS